MEDIKKYSDFFINYFSKKGEENDLTNIKLNKLLYFAYGLYLAKTGKKLFNGDFRAYKHGPVEVSIYNKYKTFGTNPISSIDNSIDEFPEDIFETLIDILSKYGDKSSWYLSNLTHDDFNSPWKKVDYLKKEKIKDEDLIDYFKDKIPKSINKITKEKETFGYINKDGDLVFPDDDEDKDDVFLERLEII